MKEISVLEYYQLLNTKEVMKLIGVKHRNSVWDYVRLGLLPKPRYPRPHRPVWRLGECLEALEQGMAQYEDAPRSFRGASPETEAVSFMVKLRQRLGLEAA